MGRPVDPSLAAQRRNALRQLLREWKESGKTQKQLGAKMDQKKAAAMLSQWANGHSPMDETSARAVERAAGAPRGYLDGPLFDEVPAPEEPTDGDKIQSLAEARDQLIASVVDLMERTDTGGRRACLRAVVLALDEYDRQRASRASGGA